MSDADQTGDFDDREGLAAEYALGTLDAFERAYVASRLDVDPELAAAVARWDELLAPLALAAPSVPAPAHVWAELSARLDGLAAIRGQLTHLRTARPAAPAPNRWRSFAIAASLAAVAFAGLFARERLAPVATSEPLVAVLQSDGKAPAFLLTVDVATRALTIRRVGEPAPSDRSHELWIISDKLGAPRSLGVVGATAVSTGTPKEVDVPGLEAATYAITLEPQGGSASGKPTGPVVFSGKLIEIPKATDAAR